MPASAEQAIIRGPDANLQAKDFVSAGLARSIVNNINHAGDEWGRPVGRVATERLAVQLYKLRRTPTAGSWSLVRSLVVRVIESPGGKSLPVVYRMRGYRSGGSGSIDWYVRLLQFGDTRTGAPILATAMHTTAGTTPTTMAGTVQVQAAALAAWPTIYSPQSDGVGVLRLARFEVWARPAAAASVPVLESLGARALFG